MKASAASYTVPLSLHLQTYMAMPGFLCSCCGAVSLYYLFSSLFPLEHFLRLFFFLGCSFVLFCLFTRRFTVFLILNAKLQISIFNFPLRPPQIFPHTLAFSNQEFIFTLIAVTCIYLPVCVCVHACARVCVCVFVCVCARAQSVDCHLHVCCQGWLTLHFPGEEYFSHTQHSLGTCSSSQRSEVP